MSEKKETKQEKKSPLIEKIKTIKHFDILLLIIFFILLLLIAFSNFNFSFLNSSSNSIKTSSNIYYMSSNEYIDNVENKLTDILSKIEGAGKVKVMLTLEEAPKYEVIDVKSNQTTISELIDLDNKDLRVINEILPQIKGVVIVASGANNIMVKTNLLNATETLLNLDTNCIQIFSS